MSDTTDGGTPPPSITWALLLQYVGSNLYFMAFAFHLLNRGLSFGFISWAIAATALVGVFIGPAAGHWIDRTRHKSRLLAGLYLTTAAGLTIQLLPAAGASPVGSLVLLTGIAIFALAYTPLTLLSSQYLEPQLKADETAAYAAADRLHGFSATAAALFAFAAFKHIGAGGLILAACATHATCIVPALLARHIDSAHQPEDPMHDGAERARQTSSLAFIVGVLRRNAFILLPILGIAATAHGIGTNVESIVAYLDAFPRRYVFLASAFEGLISVGAAAIYSARFAGDNRTDGPPYVLSLMLFALSFIALIGVTQFSGSLTPVSVFAFAYLCSSVADTWWGILSMVWIRSRAENGSYARTMAAIKVPRATVTFLGVGIVGNFLDHATFNNLLKACVLMMVVLFLVFLARPEQYRLQTQTSPASAPGQD
jgi:MFS family permease